MTYLRIGKYDNERCLKTTESTYTVNEDITEEEMKSDDANNNIHDNDYRILVPIYAIDMKNFNSKTKCPKCKHEFVSDEGIVICSICETMSLITDCHSPLLIKFTVEIANEKLLFFGKEETITKCFAIPINK